MSSAGPAVQPHEACAVQHPPTHCSRPAPLIKPWADGVIRSRCKMHTVIGGGGWQDGGGGAQAPPQRQSAGGGGGAGGREVSTPPLCQTTASPATPPGPHGV